MTLLRHTLHASMREQRRARRRAARFDSTRAPLAPGALPPGWCKEDLSVGYAHAVATAIGVTCDTPRRDINGWDVVFRARDTATADGAQLAAQLKCTENRLTRVNGGRELSF